MMKLEIQFAEETCFDLPLRQARRTQTPSFFGMVHRAWPRAASLPPRLGKLVIKHGNAIKIPAGFQTATGFHLGVETPE